MFYFIPSTRCLSDNPRKCRKSNTGQCTLGDTVTRGVTLLRPDDVRDTYKHMLVGMLATRVGI